MTVMVKMMILKMMAINDDKNEHENNLTLLIKVAVMIL